MTDDPSDEKKKLAATGTRPIVATLIVAAGRGHRAGGGMPKQYRKVAGRPLLYHTAQAFHHHPAVDHVQVVIHPDDRALYEEAIRGLDLRAPAAGGATRQESVRLGLEALADLSPDIVLIHDAARPFVSDSLISDIIDAVAEHGAGAVPALAVTDTLKKGGPLIESTVPRDRLWRAQTPQGFPFDDILKAHQSVKDQSLTDDAAVAEADGLPVRLVDGDEANVKLTTSADMAHAESQLARWVNGEEMTQVDIRTGTGFDVHQFEPGDHVWLCGVRIAHSHGLKGHSDADAGLHAVTDALLGAIGAGDIGGHFPPSDPQWRAVSSDKFLAHAADLCRRAGGTVLNVDVTLICEQPKIGPHKQAMQARLADILAIPPERANVKATTTEGLGFTGRGEGLAAQAVVTVRIGSPVEESAGGDET